MTVLSTHLDGQLPQVPATPTGRRVWFSALGARLFLSNLSRRYSLRICHADAHDAANRGPTMVLHRADELHARFGTCGLIGFGEAYMTGAWDSPDLHALVSSVAVDVEGTIPRWARPLRRAFVSAKPANERNSLSNSPTNIKRHYDLPNGLFAAFLDETMTYSAALFPDELLGRATSADLAEAQRRKIDALLDTAGVHAGTTMLELGSGWGELAVRAGLRGARVTTVTLSQEQLAVARQRVQDHGLAGHVDVQLRDYRQTSGMYDAVVSVEMIEAVGYEFIPEFFRTIRNRLVAGGLASIQAITLPHTRMLATLDDYTWIHKYIFPGGFLPSHELLDDAAGSAGLTPVDRRTLGSHYAETLRLWDERFLAADIAALGLDETFGRMWHFYLCYVRAGFHTGYLDVGQYTYRREA